MSRFLKLTDILINTTDIHKIFIQPNKYYISIASKSFNGMNFFGFGFINSECSQITICKTEKPKDYETVTNWINKIE